MAKRGQRYSETRSKAHPNYPRKNALEDSVYAQIKETTHTEPLYETKRVGYVGKSHTYLPDFILPNGVIVEVKGYFGPDDRVKHLLIKEQRPELDIRFIFSNPNTRLSKRSITTYGVWCEKYGFKYAKKVIPDSWFMEE
jgi:hypothetical protein